MGRLQKLEYDVERTVYPGVTFGWVSRLIRPVYLVAYIPLTREAIAGDVWTCVDGHRDNLMSGMDLVSETGHTVRTAATALVCVDAADRDSTGELTVSGFVVDCRSVGPIYRDYGRGADMDVLPNYYGLADAVDTAVAAMFGDWQTDIPAKDNRPLHDPDKAPGFGHKDDVSKDDVDDRPLGPDHPAYRDHGDSVA